MHPAALFYESTLRSLFPPVKFAFAYGSAVFQQQGRPKVDRIASYLSLYPARASAHALISELPNHAQGEGLMSGMHKFLLQQKFADEQGLVTKLLGIRCFTNPCFLRQKILV